MHREIVYRDLYRYDYATLRRRIGQLANALEGLGVGSGDTVAVMDWDSHRYLECYFAVPMMGAGPGDGQCPAVAGADPVNAQPCWGRRRPGPR